MQPRTLVLLPHRAARHHWHLDCLERLKRLGTEVLPLVDFAIDEARSILATKALVAGADVVVFIDDDILFDPEDVEKLAALARESCGIVAATYSQRCPGGIVVGGFDPSVKAAVFFKEGGLYPGVLCGMGFTAISSVVLQRMSQDLPLVRVSTYDAYPFFQKRIEEGRWWHEDASFCRQALRLGFKLQLDTRIRLKHQGQYLYGVEDCAKKVEEYESFTVGLDHSR